MSKDIIQPLCENKYKILAKVKSMPEAIKPFWETNPNIPQYSIVRKEKF
jgi:REP element-mobilizing transposase RayT